MLIVAVFIIGYFFIAVESVTKVNKAAVALLMFVGCWTIFMFDPGQYLAAAVGDKVGAIVGETIEHHLGSTATTLFFLMGAMTIVEVVDQNGGFNFVRDMLKTKSKRALLWRIAFMTFILSAILDNLTTSIVMIMILRKLVSDHKDRIIYAALVVIAANSGGAFSPIGDVTTIMLWNKGVITAGGVLKEITLASLVSMMIPAFILSLSLKGALPAPTKGDIMSGGDFTDMQRKIVFAVGVGGLIFVPIFKSITHLPPFVGIMLILGLLWTVTEVFYSRLPNVPEKGGMQKRVTNMLSRIDMSTILFFLGILMAVACLETVGVLTQLGQGLNVWFDGNHYLVTGIIGVLSSIVDNVPLVAGCMGMYPVDPAIGGDMSVDGIFWQLLAYCAGVGGSMLIIGSAAGVVVMGLEKISFGWYMKRISWIAFVGYIAGIAVYWVEKAVIGL